METRWNSKWRSGKKPPEAREGLVLIQVSGKPTKNVTLDNAYELAEYVPGEGWILETYPEWQGVEVVAWMPLPEPYKAEDKE